MRIRPVVIALLIGIAVAVLVAVMPHPVRFSGVEVGDIGLPFAGMAQFERGASPYDVRYRVSTATLYPFTTMLAMWPLTHVPLPLVAPLFLGFSAALLAYGAIRDGTLWRLLIFLSPAYWSAIYSVQFSPLMTAAILLPPLLPVILIKPQLGFVVALSGRWSRPTLLATALLLILSFAIWPSWLAAWLEHGNIGLFRGSFPVAILPGFLLLAAALAWRTREGRLLLAMSLAAQRYFYDHLPIFLVPRSWRQMVLLVSISWASIGVAGAMGWIDIRSGVQHLMVWRAVVLGTFLPALAIVLYNHRRDGNSDKRPVPTTAEGDPLPAGR